MITVNAGKITLYFFLTALFLFKIPNFYLVPFGDNPFFTTQSLARILTIVVFGYIAFRHLRKGTPYFTKKRDNALAILIIIFFLLQSLSALSAINMLAFLDRYKDVFLGLCSFFVFFNFKDKYLQIIGILVLSVWVNIILGVVFFLFTDIFLAVGQSLLYNSYFELLEANLARGRIYLATFDEVLIPFLLLPGIRVFPPFVFSKALLFIGITFFSLASNIRSNMLMLFVGMTSSLVAFRKIGLEKLIVSFLSVLLIGYIVNYIMISAVGVSFVDRLLFRSQFQDVDTIAARGQQIERAFLMSLESPFGVGLGNYYDNLDIEKSTLTLSEERSNEVRGASEYAHNIFATIAAESGLLSLALFVIICLVFIRHDITVIKGSNHRKKACALAFWIVFCWGLFNPPVSGSYLFLFWGLRGLAQ